MAYAAAMSQTLEKRLENLEKEFSEIRAQVLGMSVGNKDWRRTVGKLEDDEMSREAQKLGREYRDSTTLP
jgi:hypothetical protein